MNFKHSNASKSKLNEYFLTSYTEDITHENRSGIRGVYNYI